MQRADNEEDINSWEPHQRALRSLARSRAVAIGLITLATAHLIYLSWPIIHLERPISLLVVIYPLIFASLLIRQLYS